MGKRRRRRNQLLDDVKVKRRRCKLKEEVLDRNLWRTGLGRGYGAVVGKNTGWMNDIHVSRTDIQVSRTDIHLSRTDIHVSRTDIHVSKTDTTCRVAMEGSICRDGEGLNTHTLAAVMATVSAIRQVVWAFRVLPAMSISPEKRRKQSGVINRNTGNGNPNCVHKPYKNTCTSI